MSEGRSVVVTGASRGLGRATAAHLHRAGWTVLAAMRNPDRDMDGLQAAAGVTGDDDRLVPVRLDLDDERSI
ncbi:MAG: SDR family NAD(P)-dependent oxidoreductase, partial [Actinomycetota bacterium]|nr:SDR family NAD(P)-dependent oxidoreductase [Actinomycetota bacterium]